MEGHLNDIFQVHYKFCVFLHFPGNEFSISRFPGNGKMGREGKPYSHLTNNHTHCFLDLDDLTRTGTIKTVLGKPVWWIILLVFVTDISWYTLGSRTIFEWMGIFHWQLNWSKFYLQRSV